MVNIKKQKNPINNVGALICITKPLKNEIQNIFKLQNKAQVLPLGFSEKFLSITYNTNTEYDIIYSGNFSAWKGLDVFIQSLVIVDKDFNSQNNKNFAKDYT